MYFHFRAIAGRVNLIDSIYSGVFLIIFLGSRDWFEKICLNEYLLFAIAGIALAID